MSHLHRIPVVVIAAILMVLSAVAEGVEYQQERGEVVFVHTDRDVYVAGEDLFFAAYIFEPQSGRYSDISKVVYLEILNNQNTSVARTRLAVDDGIAAGVMHLPDTLSTGNYVLRAYTNYMRNQGPDSYFTLSLIVFNPFIETVAPGPGHMADTIPLSDTPVRDRASITIDESSSTRQKVVMNIRIDTLAFSLNEKTNISVSVSVSSGLRRNPGLAGLVNTHAMAIKEIDLSQNRPLLYPAEESGPLVTGTVISRQTFDPVSGIMLYLSLPGKTPMFQYAITDDNGDFRFLLPFFEEARELIIQPADFSDDWIIKINSPYSDQYSRTETNFPLWDDELRERLSAIAINYQITKIFNEDIQQYRYLTRDATLPPRFYGIPDRELIMSDFIKLPTMDEVFHELVPGVSFRRQRTGYLFNMTNETTGEPIGSPGAVLLDGVILNDHSLIAAIDPELIEKIDIIRGDYQVGSKVFTGLISIISKEGDLCGLEDQFIGVRTNYNVLDKQIIPSNFAYGEKRSEESRLPDFRNTLYWESALHPDSSGNIRLEFFASDYMSDYEVVIEGLTDKGVPVSLRRKISIRNR